MSWSMQCRNLSYFHSSQISVMVNTDPFASSDDGHIHEGLADVSLEASLLKLKCLSIQPRSQGVLTSYADHEA